MSISLANVQCRTSLVWTRSNYAADGATQASTRRCQVLFLPSLVRRKKTQQVDFLRRSSDVLARAARQELILSTTSVMTSPRYAWMSRSRGITCRSVHSLCQRPGRHPPLGSASAAVDRATAAACRSYVRCLFLAVNCTVWNTRKHIFHVKFSVICI